MDTVINTHIGSRTAPESVHPFVASIMAVLVQLTVDRTDVDSVRPRPDHLATFADHKHPRWRSLMQCWKLRIASVCQLALSGRKGSTAGLSKGYLAKAHGGFGFKSQARVNWLA